MESSASFPMWLSSTLKTREKNCQQTSTNCVAVLNSDPQIQSVPSTSPTCNPDENFQHENHSQLILSKMNNFFKAGKLKDVTLIAGKLLSLVSVQIMTHSVSLSLFKVKSALKVIGWCLVLHLIILLRCSPMSLENHPRTKLNFKQLTLMHWKL